MKSGDLIFGAAGTVGTLTLGQINVALGCAAGVLTVTILAFRLRREWRHRNDPPERDL